MVQERRNIDRAATIAEVCAEYGSVRGFCLEYGDKYTSKFYLLLGGAGGCWESSKVRDMYARLEREGLLKFIDSECKGNGDE